MTRLLSFFLALLPFAAIAAAETPATRPELGVADSAQVLSLPILKATERVLKQHQEATQETVFLVTFPKTPEGGLEARARALLTEWAPSTPKPPNTLLIAVDASRGRWTVQSGLGFDSTLGAGSERAKEIRRTQFDPEWKAGHPARAVVLSLMAALQTLESPLVDSGEAVDAYDRAGFAGGWTPVQATATASWTWIWMVLGAAIFAFALYRTLAVEVHTTGEGWHRVPVSEVLTRRLRKSKAPALVTGGGVSGRY